MYVEGVERSSKWSYTSLLITFLIFNWFSIRKKFWKAETLGLSIPWSAIPVNRITDTCKNITLPQLSLRAVKMNFSKAAKRIIYYPPLLSVDCFFINNSIRWFLFHVPWIIVYVIEKHRKVLDPGFVRWSEDTNVLFGPFSRKLLETLKKMNRGGNTREWYCYKPSRMKRVKAQVILRSKFCA